MAQILVAAKYSIQKKIGNGSFGDIYVGQDVQNGEKVAIKIENTKSRAPQLPNEARIYQTLKGAVGIPHYRYHGVESNYNVLVLDLLGPSLEDLFNYCFRRFSIKTILMLADQMISRLEFLHFNCLVHRDIKPENFLMGLGTECNKVFLIDFGLAKNYCDAQTHLHINFRDRYDLIGTARYASINAHKGIEQSRRDDMESIGYLLIYFHRGFLPWQGVKAVDKKQKYERIAELKMSTPLETICSKTPFEFSLYLSHCRSLQFTEQPNYQYLRQMFHLLFRNIGFQFDFDFDWVHLDKETRAEQQRQRDLASQRANDVAIDMKKPEGNGDVIATGIKENSNWQFH